MKKLPWTNSCYYEMINCDTYCNWWMRLRCRIRIGLWKIFRWKRPLPKEGEK